MNIFWKALQEQLPSPWNARIDSIQTVSGGDINEAYCLTSEGLKCFVKLNAASKLSMFEAEQAGLQEIHLTNTITAPEPLGIGIVEDRSYLLLAWVDMSGQGSWDEMGRQLARMHKVKNEVFGWSLDNTIGLTPQINKPCSDWLEFYRDQRLRPQFEWASRKGCYIEEADDLLNSLDRFYQNGLPKASLLHGDLWSGNASFLKDGSPIIYDPATYYGDRETDLAMTELFSGFPKAFYQAYHEEYPIDPGFESRKTLFHLYHILNHYNLFGGSYGHQARSMTQQLL